MSTHDDDDCDYEVGYGRPPKSGQFKKGHSGNPKGRPKGSRNIATLIGETVFRKVSIKDERGARKVTFAEALMHKLSVDALKGDPRALAKIIELMKYYDAGREQAGVSEVDARDTATFKVTESDLEIMRYLARELEAAENELGEKRP